MAKTYQAGNLKLAVNDEKGKAVASVTLKDLKQNAAESDIVAVREAVSSVTSQAINHTTITETYQVD